MFREITCFFNGIRLDTGIREMSKIQERLLHRSIESKRISILLYQSLSQSLDSAKECLQNQRISFKHNPHTWSDILAGGY